MAGLRYFRLLIVVVIGFAASCDEEGSDPARAADTVRHLAESITENAAGAATRRHIPGLLVQTEVMGTAALMLLDEPKVADAPSPQLRLIRRHCQDEAVTTKFAADKNKVCTNANSFLAAFTLIPTRVDKASIRIGTPDERLGQDDSIPVKEQGLVVEFSCIGVDPQRTDQSPPLAAPCIVFNGVGTLDNFRLFKDSSDKKLVIATRNLVQIYDGRSAHLGIGTIDCADKAKCRDTAKKLGEIVKIAQEMDDGRSKISKKSTVQETEKAAKKGKPDASPTKRLHASHPFVRAFLDAFQRHADGPDFPFLLNDEKTVRVFRKKSVRFLEDGRFSFWLGICQRKEKSQCHRPTDFRDVTYGWSMADIAPGQKGLRFLQMGPDGKAIKDPNLESAFALALFCADDRPCIEARSGNTVRHGRSAVLPCGRGWFGCGDALAELAIEYANFDAFYSGDNKTASHASEKKHAQNAVRKSADQLIAEIARHAKGVRYKEYFEREAQFILIELRGVSLRADGGLEVDLAGCLYGNETDALSLFSKYGEKNDTRTDYWNPKKKNDASRCEKSQGWSSARHIVPPMALASDIRIHSYDAKGTLKEGFIKSAASFSVNVPCPPGKACISAVGGVPVRNIDIPCKDEVGCKAIARSLAALAQSGASRSERQGNETATGGQETEADRLTKNIQEISRGGYFAEYDGTRRRIVRYFGKAVTLARDSRLRVSMSTCTGDCKGGSQAEDWRQVSLSDLDSGTVFPFAFNESGIDVDMTSDDNFETVAAGAFCKAGPACVEQKSGRKDKRLLVPCDEGAGSFDKCEAVIRDLKALITHYAGKGAPDETRPGPQGRADPSTRQTHSLSTAANGLIGVWAFESPFGERIKIEFRADGKFIHTLTANTFQGTWTASNGSYSIDAPQGNYEDSGTYRLVDKNTVVFNGRYGTSVWRRQ